jgi:hypothetical protein
MKHARLFVFTLVALVGLGAPVAPAAAQITSPEEEFGFPIGTNHELITYAQLQAYWQKVAGQSNRMVLDTIGLTDEGRPQLMAIITSPENHANLDRYREISKTMALAEVDGEVAARALAAEGKAVVWIDGGLHATEVVGAQQITELVYRLITADDPETLRFLDDLIILAAHANPDGMDLVSNWFYRTDAMGGSREDRNTRDVPVLYQKYAGHDNNRDFYMGNLSETTNILRVHYREWFPQIIYNHHQTGPQGTIIFVPPFRDPPNHFIDPLMLTSLDQVGSAMHHRFIQEGKGGSTMRSGASYSIWWNGGLRTTPYFHNAIGLLTEIRGGPTPEVIPFIPQRQLATTDIPMPFEPGVLTMAMAIEYSQTANWAVMDYASRNKDILLYNIWKMGRNSIERGSRDSWTVRPADLYAAADEFGGMNAQGTPDDYERLIQQPEDRDPRGFIMPADQADFPTAIEFANTLIKNGVQVHRATSDFTVEGTSYPAGSLVVMSAQAYRPHVLDMFTPQDHPNDFAYPGGPPIPPYDATGWTLAYQMGVEFDAILEGFDGPFEPVADLMNPVAGTFEGASSTGYLVRRDANHAFTLVNRLLADGRTVHSNEADGSFFIPAFDGAETVLRGLANELGIDVSAASAAPTGGTMRLGKPRIALWDRYGGSMPSGWIRFILERHAFDFEVVFPPQLDEGNLIDRYDVIILPDGAVPAIGPNGRGGYGSSRGPDLDQIPTEYQDRVGSITAETTVPKLQAFLEAGGTIIALENSTALAYHLGLPIQNHLVNAEGTPWVPEEFFIPGSLLEVEEVSNRPVTQSMKDRYIVNFARSPVLSVEPSAEGIHVLAEYRDATPLRSGWAWGQEKLQGGAALVEAEIGQGSLFLFAPQVTYRGQTHETYPLLFNGLLLSAAR